MGFFGALTAFFNVAAAGFDGGDGAAGLLLDAFDHGGDFFRGLASVLGEAADFTGDDGETATLLTGAGGLDGGVEGEEVGILGDFADDGDDFADFLRARVELPHEGVDGFGCSGDVVHGFGGVCHDLTA